MSQPPARPDIPVGRSKRTVKVWLWILGGIVALTVHGQLSGDGDSSSSNSTADSVIGTLDEPTTSAVEILEVETCSIEYGLPRPASGSRSASRSATWSSAVPSSTPMVSRSGRASGTSRTSFPGRCTRRRCSTTSTVPVEMGGVGSTSWQRSEPGRARFPGRQPERTVQRIAVAPASVRVCHRCNRSSPNRVIRWRRRRRWRAR